MWLPVLGLVLGIAIGLMTNLTIPSEYSNYLSLAVLAALDTLIGGIRAHLQGTYDEMVFVSGFFFNIYIGNKFSFSGSPSWCRLVFSRYIRIWSQIISEYSRYQKKSTNKVDSF